MLFQIMKCNFHHGTSIHLNGDNQARATEKGTIQTISRPRQGAKIWLGANCAGRTRGTNHPHHCFFVFFRLFCDTSHFLPLLVMPHGLPTMSNGPCSPGDPGQQLVLFHFTSLRSLPAISHPCLRPPSVHVFSMFLLKFLFIMYLAKITIGSFARVFLHRQCTLL